mmetsp:Transcript_1279/g.5219  ORF Transcript_1279/g.5219 Transcript_1279/m.5219 type:complete len:252 (+) Transcript_1279:1585-2340(+)
MSYSSKSLPRYMRLLKADAFACRCMTFSRMAAATGPRARAPASSAAAANCSESTENVLPPADDESHASASVAGPGSLEVTCQAEDDESSAPRDSCGSQAPRSSAMASDEGPPGRAPPGPRKGPGPGARHRGRPKRERTGGAFGRLSAGDLGDASARLPGPAGAVEDELLCSPAESEVMPVQALARASGEARDGTRVEPTESQALVLLGLLSGLALLGVCLHLDCEVSRSERLGDAHVPPTCHGQSRYAHWV